MKPLYIEFFVGMFAQSQNVSTSFITFVCVFTHINLAPAQWIYVNLDTAICLETPSFVKMVQKHLALYMKA